MKKEMLLEVVKSQKETLIKVLNQEAKEMDIEGGSCYEDAEGLVDSFDSDYILPIIEDYIGLDSFDDQDMFDEAYGEINNILFG